MSFVELIAMERGHAPTWIDAAVMPMRGGRVQWDLRDPDPARRARYAVIADWYERMDLPTCFCAAARRIHTFEALRHRANQLRALHFVRSP